MIPVVMSVAGAFLPESFWKFIMAPVPLRLSPYMSLFLAVPLVYLPFGLNLLLKIKLTGGKIDNVAPRQQAEKLALQDPMFARLQAAEKNMQEGFLIFAPAVLAAVQAGVPKETVSLLSTAWLLFRFAFICVYAVQWNGAVSGVRSLLFGFSLFATTKLFYLAA
eukprot:CAMPEP_0169140568 /NCGR_PEP_ID=MMETSP1015-20121227/43694_1 /TAXON_ID=342587 /ORGANISM="Karlodinium micrum, Strain CCMP2283" /LENGTH=163 /DNA_ID=CAMNT_0009206593 /DNA_START=59 /DNA_END=546 /DNA_ORIENTATION=+